MISLVLDLGKGCGRLSAGFLCLLKLLVYRNLEL